MERQAEEVGAEKVEERSRCSNMLCTFFQNLKVQKKKKKKKAKNV